MLIKIEFSLGNITPLIPGNNSDSNARSSDKHFTGDLITMLRLLQNTTFSTAIHRVSEFIGNE